MTRAILLKLTTVLQADTVIAAGDMTIGYTHILRVVDIDTVTIADLKIIQEVDAINNRLVATDEMYCPICTLADSDVTDGEIPNISKCQHMRTRIERLVCKRLQLVRIL